MSSCFCHFPTTFVHGCSLESITVMLVLSQDLIIIRKVSKFVAKLGFDGALYEILYPLASKLRHKIRSVTFTSPYIFTFLHKQASVPFICKSPIVLIE